ncbi:MAG TPA: AraC family transcriptional regulator ligand-binding domain-containing protein, partial [Polyangiales bacterium]|nr:AraC family transcriptional regulator ligand-binding domain-containing protein [Polyangiales bacterium]
MLNESHVSTFLLRALVDVVQRRGHAAETLLGEAASALFAEPADRTYPLDSFQALVARAIRLTDDPAIGLHCGLHASESSFGLMSPLISHAPTLRHALALVVQFQPLLVENLRVQLVEQTGVAQLRCELDRGYTTDRSFAELVVAGLARALQSFGCTRSDIRSVCFVHSRPAYHHAYTAVFLGAERFSQTWTGIEFSAGVLDRPHLHRHAQLHEVLLAQAERSLERLSRPLSCTERIRALMCGRPVSALPDMNQAARELGFSVRSLRRRLEEEGTSYRELTQSV